MRTGVDVGMEDKRAQRQSIIEYIRGSRRVMLALEKYLFRAQRPVAGVDQLSNNN